MYTIKYNKKAWDAVFDLEHYRLGKSEKVDDEASTQGTSGLTSSVACSSKSITSMIISKQTYSV